MVGSYKRKIKVIIKQFDSRFLKGGLRNLYENIEQKKCSHTAFFKHKKAVVLKEPVADMILMQLNQGENQFDQYQAYDFAVRYLAMGEYYKKNERGFELYKKMHMLGGNYGQINDVEKYYNQSRKKKRTPVYGLGNEQHSIEQFEKLIRSIEKNGYEEDSCVMTDRNLLSMNGAHRITIAFYNQQDYINAEVHNRLFKRRFAIDYFWEHGFTKNEISLIENTMKEMLLECHRRIGFFYCILFPPAKEYFDEITQDIGSMQKDNIFVVKYQDYDWEVPDFIGFLKGVYFFDSILPSDFERKLYYILRASEIHANKVRFRIVVIDIKNPMYRLKKDNGMPESMATVRLKNMIRGRYKTKDEKFTRRYVGDYAHDIIIHSSDNFISNNAFRDLLAINKDLTEIMGTISGFDYAMAANTEDKISVKFPENYYMDEDFDIFVDKRDLNSITQIVYNNCLKKFDSNILTIKIEESSLGCRVRVSYKGFTVTMFDFMTQFRGIKQEYINKFIAEKQGELFYYLSIEHQLIYRTAKFLENTSKKYHKKFLEDYKDKADINKIMDAFEGNGIKRQVKRLWKSILIS